ncbi:MAG: T9SS type A sorting domain-containing protein [Flavobacteriales bacterium]|nr:T9SS type A sorting domain-containing protein [Flavobacteriales bacterium]
MGTQNFKTGLLLVMLLLLCRFNHAQNIQFNYTNGSSVSYNLEDVRKITFDADVMNLFLWDGSVFSWNVNTIDNFNYEESYSNIQELLNNANAWNLNVCPNPTNSILNINFNLPKADEVLIGLYDIDGKPILEKDFGNKVAGEYQEILDLTNIPNGTYICRISGTRNIITKKVIKH